MQATPASKPYNMDYDNIEVNDQAENDIKYP